VQETKWKEKAKEIRKGYKIILYSGKTTTKNGVSVIVDKEMKENVVGVVWKSD